jgi:hypothetical protein
MQDRQKFPIALSVSVKAPALEMDGRSFTQVTLVKKFTGQEKQKFLRTCQISGCHPFGWRLERFGAKEFKRFCGV